jgi:hypothetical protein
MFKFDQLEIVQVEITNRCQASCPMCPRNIHGGLENPLLPINDWSLDDFTNIFTVEVLNQIRQLSFCGDFGDPILNNDLIQMCQYVKDHTPNLEVLVHTNGSARTSAWWKNLANALPENHRVIFALDGLEDTHHIYRIGTNFNKIIDNARDFIHAGGIAEWVFIKFKHNEHQASAAETMANEIGFKIFTVKNSKRFSRPFPVVDNQGKFLYNIEQTIDSVVKFVSKDDVSGHQNWPKADEIHCQSQQDKELYIDAHYLLSPCCMIGAFMYTNYDANLLKQYNLYEEDSIIDEGAKVQSQVLSFPKLNVLETGLKTIVESEQWQTMWQKKWQERSSSTCIIMCGPYSPYISINEQKIKIVETNV